MTSTICIQDNITGWGCSKFSDRVNLLTNRLTQWEATCAKIHLCIFFDSDEKGIVFHRIVQNDPQQNNLPEKVKAEIQKIITESASTESKNQITLDLNLFVKTNLSKTKSLLSLGSQLNQFIWFNQRVSQGDINSDDDPTQMGPFKKKTFLKTYAALKNISHETPLTIFDRHGNFSIL